MCHGQIRQRFRSPLPAGHANVRAGEAGFSHAAPRCKASRQQDPQPLRTQPCKWVCVGQRLSAEEDPSNRLGSCLGMSWLWDQQDVIIYECSLGQQKLLCFRPKWNEVFG